MVGHSMELRNEIVKFQCPNIPPKDDHQFGWRNIDDDNGVYLLYVYYIVHSMYIYIYMYNTTLYNNTYILHSMYIQYTAYIATYRYMNINCQHYNWFMHIFFQTILFWCSAGG